MEINKDMIISDVLNLDRGTVPISKMACIASAVPWLRVKRLKKPAWSTVLMSRSCSLSSTASLKSEICRKLQSDRSHGLQTFATVMV